MRDLETGDSIFSFYRKKGTTAIVFFVTLSHWWLIPQYVTLPEFYVLFFQSPGMS